MTDDITDRFWNGFARALGTEPTNARTIRGNSGLEHPVTVLGVDDARKRIVVVLPASSAREGALVSSDIRASTEWSVVVARPHLVNLAGLVQRIGVDAEGGLTLEAVKPLLERFQDASPEQSHAMLKPVLDAFLSPAAGLGMMISQVLAQASGRIQPSENPNTIFNLRRLLALNEVADDLTVGLCPFPVHLLSVDELSRLGDARSDDFKAKLVEMNVYQYFFPAADQLALGIVDRGLELAGRPVTREDVLAKIALAPRLGHPLGQEEIVTAAKDHFALVEELRDRKFIVEGEFGMGLGPEGNTVRAMIRHKPREGVMSRLWNWAKDVVPEVLKFWKR